jgi:hypothetical protein
MTTKKKNALRLVAVPKRLQPKMELDAAGRVVTTDPIGLHSVRAWRAGRKVMVAIGCEQHSLATWRRRGAAIIRDHVRLDWMEDGHCGDVKCGACGKTLPPRAEAKMQLRRARTYTNLHRFLNFASRKLSA